MFIFGWVFSGGNDVSYKIGVVNLDNSAIGQEMTRSLEQVTIFDISEGGFDDNLAELRRAISVPLPLSPPAFSRT